MKQMLCQVPLPLTAATLLSASLHHHPQPMGHDFALLSYTKNFLLILNQWNGLLTGPQICLTPSHLLNPPIYLKYHSLRLLLSKFCNSQTQEACLFHETFLFSHQPLQAHASWIIYCIHCLCWLFEDLTIPPEIAI